MKLEEILPELRKGKKATRKGWTPPFHIQVDRDSGLHYLTRTDILAEDWELISEPRKCKAWLNLYASGDVWPFKSSLDAKTDRKQTNVKVVETREIEWSVE
jgi:hypothetical protein